MTSTYKDNENSMDIWSKDEHNEGGKNSKWRGEFSIEWVYIKDIPNSEFSHLKVSKNNHKPFPHSRDTQEVESSVASQVLEIFHKFNHKTSLLDDFDHYNRIEEKQHAKERQNTYKFSKSRSDSNSQTYRRSSNRSSSSRYEKRSSTMMSGRSHRREFVPVEPLVQAAGSVTRRRDSGGRRTPLESNGSDVFENNDVPGVMSQLKPDVVTKLESANKDTGSDEINFERCLRKVGQPGPRAIPIVKPNDVAAEEKLSQVKVPNLGKIDEDEKADENKKTEKKIEKNLSKKEKKVEKKVEDAGNSSDVTEEPIGKSLAEEEKDAVNTSGIGSCSTGSGSGDEKENKPPKISNDKIMNSGEGANFVLKKLSERTAMKAVEK